MKHLILILLLCSGLFLSCNTKNVNSNNTGREDLIKSLEKFEKVPFVTLTSTSSENESEPTIEQYSAVKSAYSRKSNNKQVDQVVVIGSETFSTSTLARKWNKENESRYSAAEMLFSRFDQLIRYIPGYDNFGIEADEAINGKTATVYKMNLAKPRFEVPDSYKFWICKESGLPLKIVRTIENGIIITETFDYTTTVEIERPKVGKE